MVYRFFSYSKWHCNWCNFTHEDMKVVVEHEDREHPEKLREQANDRAPELKSKRRLQKHKSTSHTEKPWWKH